MDTDFVWHCQEWPDMQDVKSMAWYSLPCSTEHLRVAVLLCTVLLPMSTKFQYLTLTIAQSIFLEAAAVVTEGGKEVSIVHKLAYVGWHDHACDDDSVDEESVLPLVHCELSDVEPFLNVRRLAARCVKSFHIDSHTRLPKMLLSRVFDSSYCYRDFL